MKRHRSATSIVREFLGPQLAVIPEELVWVPAHPSYPDDGGFTYDEILKAVKMQRHWAFVRVPSKTKDEAVVHFYAANDVPLSHVAHMLGHELGHISGTILDNDAAEEKRADLYGDVAQRVLEMLSPERKSKSVPYRAGKANRSVRAGATRQVASSKRTSRSVPPVRTPTAGAGVHVRKKQK